MRAAIYAALLAVVSTVFGAGLEDFWGLIRNEEYAGGGMFT